jgi:acetolactate synthase-1/3 small subunit
MHEASTSPDSKQIIELIVNDHPGVMVHVAGLFARRAFNLEGVLCGPLAGAGRSRMLLLVGAHARLDQVIHQLAKLQDVLEVRERPDLAPTLFDLSRAA